MQKLTDDELVTKFINGNDKAFQTLFERYYRKVYSLSYRFCGTDHNLAEEATQETFLQVYNSLKRFQFKSSFYTWLYRVTFNTCSIMIKKDVRIKKQTLEGLEEYLKSDSSFEPENDLINKEHKQLVAEVLKELPEEHRQVMILGPIMGLTYLEIAEVVGESVAVVKGRLFRARQRFKKNFEKLSKDTNLSLSSDTNNIGEV